MILELEGGGGAAEGGSDEGLSIEGIPTVVEPDLEYPKKIIDALDYKVALLTRDIGLASGIQAKALVGAIYGSVFAIVLVGIPIILKLLL